ncbi:hypothetical protein ACLB1N_07420 [Escherichia coli]
MSLFYHRNHKPERMLQLSAEQAARIREMTVITSSLMMSLTVNEAIFLCIW